MHSQQTMILVVDANTTHLDKSASEGPRLDIMTMGYAEGQGSST